MPPVPLQTVQATQWTSLTISGVGLRVPCTARSKLNIFEHAQGGQGPIQDPPIYEQTDWQIHTTENITFAAPLTGDNNKVGYLPAADERYALHKLNFSEMTKNYIFTAHFTVHFTDHEKAWYGTGKRFSNCSQHFNTRPLKLIFNLLAQVDK